MAGQVVQYTAYRSEELATVATNASDDGSTIASSVGDINFGSNLSVLDDGDNTVTVDAVDTDTTYTAGTALTLSGTEFSVAGLTTSEIAGGTLLTESEGIDANDNDTSLPTAAAVKDYADSNDANTTYTAGTGLSLAGTEFSIASTVLQSGDNISELTNDSGYITNISSFTTDDLTEGSTNLYDVGVWDITSGVVSNTGNSATVSSDDFVFGSTQLDDTGNTANDTRFYFDKGTGAFRAGTAEGTQWDSVNAGADSVAFGYNNVASDLYAIALGASSTASGRSSFAAGFNSQATDNYAVAIGRGNSATALHAQAFGAFATASGEYATTFGVGTQASGNISVAFGSDTTASGDYATVFGRNIEAQGNYSFAVALDENQTGVTVPANTASFMGGRVGVGTVSPSAILEIAANGTTPRFRVESATSGLYALDIDGNDLATLGTGNGHIFLDTSGTTNVGVGTSTPAVDFQVEGIIRQSNALNCELQANANGDLVCSGTSDLTLKTNIFDLNGTSSLARINQLQAQTYNYTPEAQLGDQQEIGFIAQDVEKIFPELVGESNGYKYIRYDKLTVVLAEAVQELDDKITALEAQQASSSNDVGAVAGDSDESTTTTTDSSDTSSTDSESDTTSITDDTTTTTDDAEDEEVTSGMLAAVGTWLSDRGVEITDGIARFVRGIFNSVRTNSLVIDNTREDEEDDEDLNPAAGSGFIATGEREVEIENNQAATSSQIVVTFTRKIDTSYWVEKAEGAFKVHTTDDVAATTTFDYFILGVELTEDQVASSTDVLETIEEEEEESTGGMTPVDDTDGSDNTTPGTDTDSGTTTDDEADSTETATTTETTDDSTDLSASSTDSTATTTDETTSTTTDSESTTTESGSDTEASSTDTTEESGSEPETTDEPATTTESDTTQSTEEPTTEEPVTEETADDTATETTDESTTTDTDSTTSE